MESIIVCIIISAAVAAVWSKGLIDHKEQNSPYKGQHFKEETDSKFNIMP